MRRLVITENHGLYVVETSDGVRSTGASLASALEKLTVRSDQPTDIFAVFERITPKDVGQIASGQAGA